MFCSLLIVHLVSLLFTLCLSFFFYCYGDHRALPSFPTRRSSDLADTIGVDPRMSGQEMQRGERVGHPRRQGRSEEHTSELQSPDHLVCRLLLEKKKNRPRMSPLRFFASLLLSTLLATPSAAAE